MSYWQDHIAQLKALLQNFQQEIAPYWDKESHKEKKAQLQSIEKTITNLQKNNTSVPDELRELKFKLLKELDQFKDAEAAKAELQELLAPFQPTPKPNRKAKPRKKKPASSANNNTLARITLKDLIDAQVLPVPMQLSKKYKGKQFNAVVTTEGKIEVPINNSLQTFDSPSAAAVALITKPTNGWTWWYTKDQPKNKTLDYYRQKLKNNEAQRRR